MSRKNKALQQSERRIDGFGDCHKLSICDRSGLIVIGCSACDDRSYRSEGPIGESKNDEAQSSHPPLPGA
jgi:hypothetical protein